MEQEISQSLKQYRESAMLHGIATIEGDYRRANVQHDKLMVALAEIRALGADGSERLLSLIGDENEGVRCWAATHSLAYNEEEAMRTLELLAQQEGPISFNAEMVLSEWKKGTLEF